MCVWAPVGMYMYFDMYVFVRVHHHICLSAFLCISFPLLRKYPIYSSSRVRIYVYCIYMLHVYMNL